MSLFYFIVSPRNILLVGLLKPLGELLVEPHDLLLVSLLGIVRGLVIVRLHLINGRLVLVPVLLHPHHIVLMLGGEAFQHLLNPLNILDCVFEVNFRDLEQI